MTTVVETNRRVGRQGGRARLGGRAAGAIVDQGVVAGTSFVLMILVRHQLGSAALGEYAILINASALITSLQTAWVGDSLTVLDRFDTRIRRGLTASILAFSIVCVVVGAALALGVQKPAGALLFGGMVLLWVLEEVGRRIYMARFEFWQLVLNDVIYAAGAFVGLVFLRQIVGSYSVTLVVGAMAIGAGLSVFASFLQLPRYELHWVRPSKDAFGDLSKFAAWRSAQMGIRPLALYVVRVIVIVAASKQVLGDLEGARLFSQPAMTYVSGVASLLLPMYTQEEERKTRAVPVPVMTALLVVPIVVYGAVVLAYKQQIANHLLANHAHVSTVAIIGWMAVAVMFAAGQPMSNLLVARRRARGVFWVRAADSAVGLAIAGVVVRNNPDLAPWSLAGGMLVGTLWLSWLTLRSAPIASPPPSDDDGPPLVASHLLKADTS